MADKETTTTIQDRDRADELKRQDAMRKAQEDYAKDEEKARQKRVADRGQNSVPSS